jgi:hypothetical protein
MKKIITILLVFFTLTNFSQKNDNDDYLNEYLKEVIVIYHLLNENRIDNLSSFLDKHSYIASENNRFMKFEIDQKDINLLIQIASIKATNRKALNVFFLNSKEKGTKLEVENMRSRVLKKIINTNKNITEYPFSFISRAIEGIKNKNIAGATTDFYENYEIINRYSYKWKKADENAEWEIHRASNWTWMFSDEKIYRLTFLGGNFNYHISFYNLNDKLSTDLVNPIFVIKADEPISTKNKSSNDNTVFNVDFFMGLKNWNDVIWSDNK